MALLVVHGLTTNTIPLANVTFRNWGKESAARIFDSVPDTLTSAAFSL
jgi:hypothetical protein